MKTLASEVAAFAAALREQAPLNVLEGIDRSTELLVQSGLADRALRRADRAPDFLLRDAVGDLVDSRHLRSRGPVVLRRSRNLLLQYRAARMAAAFARAAEVSVQRSSRYPHRRRTPR